MKVKDFNASFEKLKDFKSKYPKATDEDEFFKALNTRLRKYVKKFNRIVEIEEKIHKNKTEPTAEQRDLISKKKELDQSLRELVEINAEYIKNFDNHCQQIWSHKQSLNEQAKQEVAKEEVPNEDVESEPEEEKDESPQPAVDVEAIRNEEYQRGFQEGRHSVSQKVAEQALSQGRNQGFNDAKQQFELQSQALVEDTMRRTADYWSLIVIFGFKMETYLNLDPPFNRAEFFTEDELTALHQLFTMCQMIAHKFNYKDLIDCASDRIIRLVNKDSQLIQNSRNVTYRQLADSIDRAFANPNFVATLHQLMPMENPYMPIYASMMPGSMMGGQSLPVFPSMYSSQPAAQKTTPQVYNISQETEVHRFAQNEEVKVGKTHTSESMPAAVPHEEDNAQQDHPTQTEIDDRIWHEVDDDDDDQDHEEAGDSLSHEDQGEPEHPAYEEDKQADYHQEASEEQAVEGEIPHEATTEDQKAVEQEGDHQHKTRGYHRGQRRGPRRGYHYERNENEEHRGRPYRGPRRSQRYRQYRGGREAGYDNSYGGYNRGYRGGYDKEGDKGNYWNQNKRGKFKKEPEKTIDDDGFFIVKK
jgi:hypothetical protein